MSGNTFGAVYWSDMKREAPMLPESPELVVCRSCRAVLWIASLQPIGEVDWYRSPPGEGQIPEEWEKAPGFRTPDANDLVEALKVGCANTPERERYIRIRLWWTHNDRHRKVDGTRSSRDASFQSNLDCLAMLLADTANDTLLRAEIARQSGHFEQSVAICEALVSMNPERHLIEMATLIRDRALAKDQWVFKR